MFHRPDQVRLHKQERKDDFEDDWLISLLSEYSQFRQEMTWIKDEGEIRHTQQFGDDATPGVHGLTWGTN